MKLLGLMWLLLQPSSTPLKEKSLAYSMNMPTLGRAHPFIHQVNLNGLRPMLMKNLSKFIGTQLITTLDGYSVPILIKDGLAYVTYLGRPTDQDMDTYPHVFFTSPDEWDPSVLDHDPPHLDGLDPSQVLDQPFGDPMFDAYGDFNERIIANLNILLDAPPEDYRPYIANLHQGSSQEPDWNALHTVVQMEALLVQICVSSTKPSAKITFKELTIMKLLGLMWLLLQPSSTPLKEKSLAYSMNMPTLGRAHPFIHQVNLNGLRPMLMKNLSKFIGTQLITTLDGYSVPILIKDGLAYVTYLGRPTGQDMDTYPHVFFTSPDEWDPSVLDHDPPHLDGLDPSQVPDQPFGDPMFDAYGDFNECIIANLNILLDAPPEDCGSYTEISSVFTATLHQSSPQEPDWNALRPFFAWTSPSSIKDTFNVTTRHGTAPHTQNYIKKHFKSRNPVFNIPRRSEAVATDTIFFDTPAVDDGSTMAQFFCGRDTLVCDAYGIKSTKQFINTLSDNIRKWGAMDTLISDGGKYEISKQVTDLLCSLFIQDYQSEPYHQHQN